MASGSAATRTWSCSIRPTSPRRFASTRRLVPSSAMDASSILLACASWHGWRLQIDHAAARGMRNRIGATGGVELVEQRADVKLDGVHGDAELTRDHLVR